MYNYNPMQARAESLMQQKQMIDSQLQQLQQYANIPPININNQITPQSQSNYDFNGRWVIDENEARGIANNNLPLILFDKNNPIFYMKNIDGSFKKFQFKEIVEQQQIQDNDRINVLEEKMNKILNALVPKKENVEKDKKVSDEK